MHTNIALLLFTTLLSGGFAHAQGQLAVFTDLPDRACELGDLDGDGYPEIALARRGAGPLGEVRAHSLRANQDLWIATGPYVGDGFGASLAAAGDFDQDGIDDLAIGAPFGNPGLFIKPALSIHSGANGAQLLALTSIGGSRFGAAVVSDGDIDGDGRRDWLVGAPSDSGPGEVQVYSGAAAQLVRLHTGTAGPAGEFGAALCFLGDLDGDARDDYAVGDPRTAGSANGEVRVFSGASGAQLYALSPGQVDAFGSALCSIGDVDGDGRRELVVGAPIEFIATYVTGAVRVHSGGSGALLHHLPAGPGSMLGYGSSLASLGDWDGDGAGDFAAHFPFVWVGGTVKNFGSARVVSGATGQALEYISLGHLGPIASAGDVNLDGAQDLFVSGGVATPVGFTGLFLGNAAQVETYCQAKLNSQGCTPLSWAIGGPSVSVGPGCEIHASSLVGQKNGLFFWGVQSAAVPFAGGTLCVAPPLHRTHVQNSGGASATPCSGELVFTFDRAYLAAHGLGAGQAVFVQAWHRDPGFAPPQSVGLTRGTHLVVWP